MNLNYLMPTRIIMGENCLFNERSLLAQLGKKACMITGKHSARACGGYDDAVKALEANGQQYVLYDGVMNNPTDNCVFEAGELAGKEGCDFILAIGGGSPMDAAKAAAVLAAHMLSKEELFALSFDKVLPIAAVPTTAGTGSETTPYSILVDTAGPAKRSIGSPLLFPRFAFLDHRYLRRLGRDTTVHTAMDALSHAVEGILSPRANCISDTLARETIAIIRNCFGPLMDFPADPAEFPAEIRKKLLLASSMAGMVISQTGTTVNHSMGYQLTINWGTDHGRATGLLLGPFLRWCREKERADSSIKPRIPGLCAALGMDLEDFCAVLENLLGKRERASEAELGAWGKIKMKNAVNTYIEPCQEEIADIFRKASGGGRNGAE
ncbi:MAG: iron-containing alcohol dehydrogenase [Treponema sp.]|jgi:alcohol dehydrogenase class IV|nr:iron-containing alcohol dehydrogenase [Treponema sp.]